MFQIEFRISEARPEQATVIWSEWFRYSVPTNDGKDCAEYLKMIVENSAASLKRNPLYTEKQFRMIYIPADKSR